MVALVVVHVYERRGSLAHARRVCRLVCVCCGVCVAIAGSRTSACACVCVCVYVDLGGVHSRVPGFSVCV